MLMASKESYEISVNVHAHAYERVWRRHICETEGIATADYRSSAALNNFGFIVICDVLEGDLQRACCLLKFVNYKWNKSKNKNALQIKNTLTA